MTSAKISFPLLVVMLAGVAVPALAVSLGAMRGSAIIGRTFDVTAVVQLAPNEAASGLCVASDIVFGETPLGPHRVTTTVSPGANASEALVRIRTSVAVDEPVVTVTLREGCEQKNIRKYVFLSEVATGKLPDVSLPSPALAQITLPSPPPLSARNATAIDVAPNTASTAPSTSTAQAAVPPTAKKRRTELAGRSPLISSAPSSSNGETTPQADRVSGLSARAVAKAAMASKTKPSRARLQLDPIDLSLPERDPVLRISTELLTQPAADPQQRAAAAALWKALNAQPQDVLRDGQRLKSLEDNVTKMLAQNQLTSKAVTDLRVQLEQSRSERFSNWLVYTLAALLLLAIAAAAYALLRRERSLPWWGKADAAADPADRFAFGGEAAPAPAYARSQRSSVAPMAAPARFEDSIRFDAEDTGDSLPSGLGAALLGPSSGRGSGTLPEPLAARDRMDFSVSMPRIVNAEELFDVQQQADFFVSLGDYNKAVEILRLHINDHVETSALAYLDLFALYHQLGRQAEYETLSEEFSRTFNARLPAFENYKTETQDLESYDATLASIVAQWPTPKVLEVIEASIFRKPDSQSAVFSLAAYRDLLLLHAIAKKVVDPMAVRKTMEKAQEVKRQERGFVNTSIQPAQAQWEGQRGGRDASDLTRPPASRHLGLDIDLTDMGGFAGSSGFGAVDELSFDLDPPHLEAAGQPEFATGPQTESPDLMLEPLDFELFPIDRPKP